MVTLTSLCLRRGYVIRFSGKQNKWKNSILDTFSFNIEKFNEINLNVLGKNQVKPAKFRKPMVAVDSIHSRSRVLHPSSIGKWKRNHYAWWGWFPWVSESGHIQLPNIQPNAKPATTSPRKPRPQSRRRERALSIQRLRVLRIELSVQGRGRGAQSKASVTLRRWVTWVCKVSRI